MSKPRKLTCPESGVTKLKLLWRDSLSEPDRDYWREQFGSARSQSELRQELHDKYHLDLLYDMQLTRFRRWVDEQDALEAEEQKAVADREELEKLGLTDAQLRDELLRRMKARALTRGDFNLGLQAIATAVRVEALQLGWDKFKEKLRTKIQAGLDEVAEAFKANPEAMASYKKACELVSPVPK